MLATWLLIILWSEPRTLPVWDSVALRSWVMWVTWILWMACICWMVLLWYRKILQKYIDGEKLSKMHMYAWIWTILSFFFHPLAALVSYWTSVSYLWSIDVTNEYAIWVSVWKIAFDLCIILAVGIWISKYILKQKWSLRLHASLYIWYIWIWLHGLFAWSLIYTNIFLLIIWMSMWVLVFASAMYTWYMLYTGRYIHDEIKLFAHRIS